VTWQHPRRRGLIASWPRNLAEILETRGYHALVASSAERALALVEQQAFDGIHHRLQVAGLDGVSFELPESCGRRCAPMP
jgi:DNA-binding NtrC family response regulator